MAEIVNRFEETKITFIKADVTKILELEGAFETTIKKYQQLDIVINNAGQVDEFDRKGTVEVNLVSTWWIKIRTKQYFRLDCCY